MQLSVCSQRDMLVEGAADAHCLDARRPWFAPRSQIFLSNFPWDTLLRSDNAHTRSWPARVQFADRME